MIDLRSDTVTLPSNEMKEFINCLINNDIPSVGIKNAIISIRIALAAKLSYTENRKVELREIS